MTYSPIAARAAVGAAALALVALAVLHVLKPDVQPGRSMISMYALGRHGWLMALCFAAFAAASACLFAALLANVGSVLGRIGLVFLVAAAVGLALAARFPMDPAATLPEQMSFSGRMHGVAFMIGVPGQVLAVLLLSLALGNQSSYASLPLLPLAALIWLSLIGMMAIIATMGNPPDPDGLVRILGWPNRLLMVGYAVWLVLAAWPVTR